MNYRDCAMLCFVRNQVYLCLHQYNIEVFFKLENDNTEFVVGNASTQRL